MSITTHILDLSQGRPAAGVPVKLEKQNGAGKWEEVGAGATDSDGRLKTLVKDGVKLSAGIYALTFDTAKYFKAQGTKSFYPYVNVVFELAADAPAHHHVPLLLSPFGYSTYRGS